MSICAFRFLLGVFSFFVFDDENWLLFVLSFYFLEDLCNVSFSGGIFLGIFGRPKFWGFTQRHNKFNDEIDDDEILLFYIITSHNKKSLR